MSSRSRNIAMMARNQCINEMSNPYSDIIQKNTNNGEDAVVSDDEILEDEVTRHEPNLLSSAQNVTSIPSDGIIDIEHCIIVTADGIILNNNFGEANDLTTLRCLEENSQNTIQPDVDAQNYFFDVYNTEEYFQKKDHVTYEPTAEEIKEFEEEHIGKSSFEINSEEQELVEQEQESIEDRDKGEEQELVEQEQESIEDLDKGEEQKLVEQEQESIKDIDTKVKRNRKRNSNSQAWKRSIAKRERNLGNEYQNKKGKMYPKKKAKVADCSKCKLKCNDKLTLEDIERINHCYWKTGSYERQRDFICKYVKTKLVTRRRKDTNSENPRRNMTYKYFFPGDIQVCKKTFLQCLDISDKTVRVAKKKEVSGSSMISKDGRGKHSPKNKTTEARRRFVHNHINSFPVMESHYCRSKTNRCYLSSDLNITKMYELYLQKCTEENMSDPVSAAVYRRIFVTNYNLGFHRPKKDSCAICEKYKQANDELKDSIKETYERHIKNKELSRAKKDNDKKKAISEKSFKSVTFDLQAVLYTPCSELSHYYYALKFCSYNLCVFDQATKDGYSYFWTEIDGKRGSDEIGTAILTYLKDLPDTVKHVSLYSDSCGGQNRNRYLAALFLYAVRQLSIEVIDHNFLETGHTDMEVDSMHSAIETNKKHQKIYTPHEWPTIIRTARRKKPYHVKVLSFSDILDLKALKMSLSNKKMSHDKDGNTINWMKIKMLQFRKTSPMTIFLKEDHDQENFIEMPLDDPIVCVKPNLRTKHTIPLRVSQRNTRNPLKTHLDESNIAPKAENPKENLNVNLEIKRKYTGPLPISEKKKKSLMNLCRIDAMPAMYHHFYQSLPCSGNVVDRLPEPDQEENNFDQIP